MIILGLNEESSISISASASAVGEPVGETDGLWLIEGLADKYGEKDGDILALWLAETLGEGEAGF